MSKIIAEIASETLKQIIIAVLSEITKNGKELISGVIKRALKLCFCMEQGKKGLKSQQRLSKHFGLRGTKSYCFSMFWFSQGFFAQAKKASFFPKAFFL